MNKSGIPPLDWYVSLVFIGLAEIAFWVKSRRLLPPPFPSWLTWTIRGLLLYLIFQMIPLPLPLLNFLSPARAEFTRSLAPIAGSVTSAPISVDPAAHLLWFLTIAGCTAAFYLLRDLTFRLQNRLFFAILPLLLVAGFEAILGLLQVAGGAVEAVGSYNSRDHYCCILEQTLPIAVALGLLFFGRRSAGSSIWPIVQAIFCWILAALLTLAIFASLSRAGWIDSILSLLLLIILVLFPRISSARWRIGFLGALLVFVLAAFVFASPGAMLVRLVSASNTESEGRLYIWKELIPLTREFRWFGTGLMGFDPAFLRYQAIVNAKRIDFAHNDFLQYLIEMGLVGFIPLVVCMATIVTKIVKASWPRKDQGTGTRAENRLLLIGCVASFAALFVHSLVDFNLYIPANMFTFAWILGFGSALAAIGDPQPDSANDIPNKYE